MRYWITRDAWYVEAAPMSANIYYRKIGKDRCLRTTMAPSIFIAAAERAFGEFPCEVGPGEVPILRGLEAARPGEGWAEVIELVERLGRLRLYAEY